jgi:hypothetical protein
MSANPVANQPLDKKINRLLKRLAADRQRIADQRMSERTDSA